MFERFTDGARRVVVVAQEEARRLRHPEIGTEHLLIALLVSEDGATREALAPLGAARARAAVEDLRPAGDVEPGAHMPFTAASKRTMELSLRAALRLGQDWIGTGHLLLGLLAADDAATQILRAESIEPDEVRARLEQRLADQDPPEDLAAAERVAARVTRISEQLSATARNRPGPEQAPWCPWCATPLGDTGVTHTALSATPTGGGGERFVILVACGGCGATLGILPAG